MIEVAEVFRRFAADYLSAHGASMLPSHQRAINDILNCRTAALGGQVWRCEQCNTEIFSYHSCANRSCPKCHTAQTQAWLEHRQTEMLPDLFALLRLEGCQVFAYPAQSLTRYPADLSHPADQLDRPGGQVSGI